MKGSIIRGCGGEQEKFCSGLEARKKELTELDECDHRAHDGAQHEGRMRQVGQVDCTIAACKSRSKPTSAVYALADVSVLSGDRRTHLAEDQPCKSQIHTSLRN